ncbi:LysR family transcriptional regulator [Azonexus hydrophilus]|uniref:LysR family transcriptional regulator n=1 Tax=Azonexus hydrophilus TaxID=418702 RepID=UPI00197A8FE2|nr:LysR family transcriptional regulator [Azonexus hydrophilus]
MRIKNLHDLQLFVRAAELGSLSAAARQLDLSPALASAGLKRLEAELGVPLMLRSTRSLRLSREGERLLPAARLALDGLRDATEEIATGRQVIRDHLQISLPSDLGRNHILGWLDAFQARWPDVSFRLQFSDRAADVYRQPVDLAIRYGSQPDSGLVALPLHAANQRILCAAPAYLARHGTPGSPEELTRHNCLRFKVGDELHDHWRFTRAGKEIRIEVSGDRACDDGDAVRRWAVAGRGIAYKSGLDIAEDIASRRLIRLCPDWQGETVPLALICADRRQLSPTVVLLREHLREQCEALGQRLETS